MAVCPPVRNQVHDLKKNRANNGNGSGPVGDVNGTFGCAPSHSAAGPRGPTAELQACKRLAVEATLCKADSRPPQSSPKEHFVREARFWSETRQTPTKRREETDWRRAIGLRRTVWAGWRVPSDSTRPLPRSDPEVSSRLEFTLYVFTIVSDMPPRCCCWRSGLRLSECDA